MSTREERVKATAAALQPKSLDLTRFAKARSASNEEGLSVRHDEAAGALAFSALDRYEDVDGKQVAPEDPSGSRLPGDELPGMLLRLKTAQQVSLPLYTRTLALVLKRHRGGEVWTKHQDTMTACAAGALFEWMNDQCPNCREQRSRPGQPQGCPVCGPIKPAGKVVTGRRESEPYLDPWGQYYLDRGGHIIHRVWVSGSPRPGCTECAGTGRVFQKVKEHRGGVRCTPCHNSGRLDFHAKERWRFVNDYIRMLQRDRDEEPVGLKLSAFYAHWSGKYCYVLDALRGIERRGIGVGLDLHHKASHNRSIETALGPKQDAEGSEVGASPSQEQEEYKTPAVPVLQDGGAHPDTGTVPTQES